MNSGSAIDQRLAGLVFAAGQGMKQERTVVGECAGAEPSLVLFHAAASVCSQKVRAVLAHHGISYASYLVNLFAGEPYWPDYIRLRMIGCRRLGIPLARLHTGSTAAQSGGCDGVVVPTLVDLATGEVVVDSRLICVRLDSGTPQELRLRPEVLADAIDEELAIVDELPNYQLLMGRSPGAASADAIPSETAMASFSRRKVDWCNDLIARYPDDEEIIAACIAKRSKEQSAAEFLFSATAMAHAHEKVATVLADLDARLAAGAPAFRRDNPTLADLIWAVELLRIENVGHSRLWSGGQLPEVERFVTAARSLPAIQASVIDWPGAVF